jgi:hypothetical protein
MIARIALFALAAAVLSAPIAAADPDPGPPPTRCKDVPGNIWGGSRICQFPDGSVTKCLQPSVPAPVVGPSCFPFRGQLPAGFWDQP